MLTKEKLMARTIQRGECRVWTGYIHKKTGYGLVWADGRTRQAHVVSYERHHGPIPPGLCVLHSCDNRPCIEGSHLFAKTKQDNTDDMVAKGREKKVYGVYHGLAKLTPELVKIIRKRYVPYDRKNGASALAREFGVTQPTIWSALIRRTWAKTA